ncbi:MAG: methionine--tRNA ligase [Phycisphaerales bacterium]|nr:methionine--tRNA ligase [Phycisphaerales bacterium]
MVDATRTITTPIYYVNGRPHLGHAYTTTICDVWARFQRAAGQDVFFLTGTDEHGQKVEESAREQGMTPKALADLNAAEFQRIMGLFGLSNDAFIRTTDPAHERQVQTFVQRLIDSGDVYLGTFEGWYDPGQEEYYTQTKARECDFKSPISGRPLEKATEENFYFRLSAYQERLEALYDQQPGFVRPEARRNEMLGRLREGLQDVPISRTNFTWGIPVPGHEAHVIYVWIDALFNYITALDLADSDATQAKYWPATYHIVGKEILWFHAVIWPALLMALKIDLPSCVYAHSFWISEGQKMSKSLGNFVDLERLQSCIDTYGRDALRWYLATNGPLGATDADFTMDQFHDVYTTDLVNTFGNCASRVSAMINKYFDGALPEDCPGSLGSIDLQRVCLEQTASVTTAMEAFDLGAACSSAMQIVRKVDAFINETEPFKKAKDPDQLASLQGILYRCAESIRIASALLEPVMPETMQRLTQAWQLPEGGPLEKACRWGGLKAGQSIEKVALFPRAER